MNSKDVISVNNLTKIYKFYHNPIHRLKEFFVESKKHTEFVALNNASFTVKRGKTLGIIGENGAGKSTLLQLVAGTISPTSGEVTLEGRVLALLELGIGFHPDFTGRENIFFYGDLLGFSRSFIQSKFREIVEFSELGDFIDRPIKTYSTGMQMRLAFSLISSLEPYILIIDEVLAVGDMHFQKKCIDRIMNFKNKGITILFCSHSTYQVSILCDEVIWLKDGKIEMQGEPQVVIPAYDYYQLEKGKKIEETSISKSTSPVLIKEMSLMNALPLKRGADLKFRILIESKREDIKYHVTFSLKVDPDWGVYATGTHMVGRDPLSGRRKEIVITFPKIPIMGGFYYAHGRVFDENGVVLYHEKIYPPFEVIKDSLERGVCYLNNDWGIRDL
jgi:ABC-type polysaccharide/polyol phosphate transport system ATPase subunit